MECGPWQDARYWPGFLHKGEKPVKREKTKNSVSALQTMTWASISNRMWGEEKRKTENHKKIHFDSANLGVDWVHHHWPPPVWTPFGQDPIRPITAGHLLCIWREKNVGRLQMPRLKKKSKRPFRRKVKDMSVTAPHTNGRGDCWAKGPFTFA